MRPKPSWLDGKSRVSVIFVGGVDQRKVLFSLTVIKSNYATAGKPV